MNTVDTLSGLFEQALTADTIEFGSERPFLYFKSGHMISRTEKDAVTVECPNDATYSLKLYSCQGKKWQATDSITGLDALLPPTIWPCCGPTEFDVSYADFNFDHQRDIYIQAVASNGYPLLRGYLIIVDPVTKKLTYHKEASELANMKLFPKTKTVMSEEWPDLDDSGRQKLTILTNKWINGKLRTIKKNI